MTTLRIFTQSRPMQAFYGSKLLPMQQEERDFHKLRKERSAKQ